MVRLYGRVQMPPPRPGSGWRERQALPERVRQAQERCCGWVARTTFDAADLGLLDAGQGREVGLGQTPGLASSGQLGAELLPLVHLGIERGDRGVIDATRIVAPTRLRSGREFVETPTHRGSPRIKYVSRPILRQWLRFHS